MLKYFSLKSIVRIKEIHSLKKGINRYASQTWSPGRRSFSRKARVCWRLCCHGVWNGATRSLSRRHNLRAISLSPGTPSVQCLAPFQTIVGILGDRVPASIRSAGPNIERPLSSGKQTFDMNRESWPIGEPVPKLESAAQISGEETCQGTHIRVSMSG